MFEFFAYFFAQFQFFQNKKNNFFFQIKMGMPSTYVLSQPSARKIKFNKKILGQLSSYNIYLGGMYNTNDENEMIDMKTVIMECLDDSKMYGYFSDDILKILFHCMSIFKILQEPQLERIRIHFNYIESLMYYYEITSKELKIVIVGNERDTRFFYNDDDDDGNGDDDDDDDEGEDIENNAYYDKDYLNIKKYLNVVNSENHKEISCSKKFPEILKNMKFELKKNLLLLLF